MIKAWSDRNINIAGLTTWLKPGVIGILISLSCHSCVYLSSGWDDGQIRAFSPETGHLMYSMEHAYGGSTTALATTKDSQHIVSGSNIGHVVVWKAPNSSSLTNVKNGSAISVKKHDLLKEHKAKVTCIKINAKGTECVTSSIDGSCIIWDLV